MARYISSTINSSVGALATTLTSNDSISQGDLITLASDGYAYWAADPTLPVTTIAQYMRPAYVSSTLSNISVLLTPTLPNLNGSTPTVQSSAILSNGNIVYCYNDSAANAYFRVVTPQNTTVVADTLISSTFNYGTYTVNLAVCALTGGGFAVGWFDNAATYPKVAVYSSTGSVVAAAATVDGVNTGPSYGIPSPMLLVALTGGGFAYVYLSAASSDTVIRHVVYTATGTVTTAAASLVTAGSTTRSPYTTMSACALTNGGYVVTYPQSANNYPESKVLTSTGSTTATVTQTSTLTNSGTGKGTSTIGLTGGGFALVCQRGSGGISVAVYNASGALQGSIVNPDTTADWGTSNARPPACALTGGGLQVMWYMSTGTKLYTAQISAAGAQVGTNTQLTASGTIYGWGLAASGDGGAVAMCQTGQTSYYSLWKISTANVVTTSIIGSSTTGPQLSSFSSVFTGPMLLAGPVVGGSNYVVVVGYAGPGLTANTYFAGPTRLPIGIATAAAASSNPCVVQITGSATTRLTFSQPWSCSYNTAATPGQRMSVIGNTAIMNGTQSATPQLLT